MENLEETLKKYPLIALIILLGAISCFAVASAAPIMTNIANPYMLWLKQGLYYVLGGALSYIIYKIGQDTLYTRIQNIIYGFYCITYWTCRGSFSLYKTTTHSYCPTRKVY